MAIKKFAIVIDAQYDFMKKDGKLYVNDAEDLIPRLVQYLTSLDPNVYQGVLFTLDTHIPEVYANSDEAKQFPPHCEKETDGWRLVAGPELVEDCIPVFTMEKGVFAMWQEEGLLINGGRFGIVEREQFFNTIKTHVSEGDELVLEFSGVAADFCVKWGMEGAVERGFKTIVRHDLTAGIVRQIHQVVEEDFQGKDVLVVSDLPGDSYPAKPAICPGLFFGQPE